MTTKLIHTELSCGVPVVQKDVVIIDLNETFVIESVVSYTCSVNDSHFDVATSVCTEESKWSPDPLKFTCKNNQNTKGIITWYHSIYKFTK